VESLSALYPQIRHILFIFIQAVRYLQLRNLLLFSNQHNQQTRKKKLRPQEEKGKQLRVVCEKRRNPPPRPRVEIQKLRGCT
jgi:hypothetical protein